MDWKDVKQIIKENERLSSENSELRELYRAWAEWALDVPVKLMDFVPIPEPSAQSFGSISASLNDS
jgi:hypothetical protein